MLSSTTSGYQRYCTNSVPAHAPLECGLSSALVRVSVFVAASMLLIWRISMSSVPSSTAIQTPSRYFATELSCSVVSPVWAAALSRLSSSS